MRRFALVTLVVLVSTAVCCDPWSAIRIGSRVEVDAELTIWADHMPVSPPDSTDRLYALVDVHFRNRSEVTVVVEVERVIVVPAAGGGPVFGFSLEQRTDWNGVLGPGESGGGQWSKAEQVTETHPPCGSDVFAIVAIRAVREDGEPVLLRRTVTPATRFVCTQ